MEEMICINHPDAAAVSRCTRCLRQFCADCLVSLGGRPFCAECKIEHLRDAESGVVLNALELASLGRRFLARVIDSILIAIPFLLVLFAVGFRAMMSSGGEHMPPLMSFVGLIQIPIGICYEALMLKSRGQTVGKIVLNLRVTQPDGRPLSTGQAWGRAAVRSGMISLLALINYLPAFFTAEKTAVHDMAASTRVING